MALHIVATSVRYAANGGVLGGLVGMASALVQGVNSTQQMEGSMKEYVGSIIPEHTKQWHTKPVGAKVCPTCQCDNVRAGVRHRIREDETGYWYEKIIKVCFGTDTSIEVIKPKK